MSVYIEPPLLVSTFDIPKESVPKDVFLAEMCPNQCGKSMECYDILLNDLREAKRIAHLSLPVSEGADPLLECYDESKLREWEKTLFSRSKKAPFTTSLLCESWNR